jgi:Effector-associated domain 7
MGPTPADIRKLLMDAFSDEEIQTLCFDHFPQVLDEFSAGMSKSDKVLRLLIHCRHYDLASQLLSAIHDVRPSQYAKAFGGISPDQLQSIFAGTGTSGGNFISLANDKAKVEELIVTEQEWMRFYLVFAAALVVVGLGIATAPVSSVLKLDDALRPGVVLVGGFVTALGVFQFKEILSRKQRARMFESCRLQLADALGRPTRDMDAETCGRIHDIVWQATKKIIVG